MTICRTAAEGDVAMSESKDTNANASEADARLVASFRLPVAVKGLIVLSGWLRTQYGDGLAMRQEGEFLYITKPTEEAEPQP
jgi:hypothetical protein